MSQHEKMYRDILSNDDAVLCNIRYKNVSLHSGGICSHPDCKQTVYSCDGCLRVVCPNLRCTRVYMKCSDDYARNHAVCEECNEKITCRPSQMCIDCANNHRYDMITEHLAVGDFSSSYAPFDLIVNLDYPENDAQYHEISIRQMRRNPCVKTDPITELKPVILCGFFDAINEFNMGSLRKIMMCIAEESKRIIVNKHKLPKILIHCAAGISRSSTVAIAYLSDLLCITHQEAYQLVKLKRRVIKPNEGFQRLLRINPL